jgi:hypothetical protein
MRQQRVGLFVLCDRLAKVLELQAGRPTFVLAYAITSRC